MKVFTEHLEYVQNEVGKALSTSPLIIRAYTKHLLQSEGKYIRAKAVLASALRNDGTIHYDAVKFAAAIELLHLATLVHDDVMDDADTRRGIPTLHKKYGRKTAIICGDYILAVAMSLAASVEEKDRYQAFEISNYMEAIALGELKQHINNGNVKLTLNDYYEIIDGKTAKLFEASMFSGSMTSGESIDSVHKYQELGYNIGMIFQLLDDVSDFEDTKRIALKPVQSDFEQGVITMPLILAFEQFPEYQMRAQEGTLTREEIDEIVRSVEGVNKTRDKAREFYEKSNLILLDLEINEEKRSMLKQLLNNAMRI